MTTLREAVVASEARVNGSSVATMKASVRSPSPNGATSAAAPARPRTSAPAAGAAGPASPRAGHRRGPGAGPAGGVPARRRVHVGGGNGADPAALDRGPGDAVQRPLPGGQPAAHVRQGDDGPPSRRRDDQ